MRAEELPVSPGVRKVLREAEELRRSKNHPRLGVYHQRWGGRWALDRVKGE